MTDIKTSALSLAARAILAGLDAGRWIAARTTRLGAAGAVAAGGSVALPIDAATAAPAEGVSFEERVGAVRKTIQQRGMTVDEVQTGGETQMAWRNRWPSTAVGGVRG